MRDVNYVRKLALITAININKKSSKKDISITIWDPINNIPLTISSVNFDKTYDYRFAHYVEYDEALNQIKPIEDFNYTQEEKAEMLKVFTSQTQAPTIYQALTEQLDYISNKKKSKH